MLRNSEQLRALLEGLAEYRKHGPQILFQIGTEKRILVNEYLKESGEIDESE